MVCTLTPQAVITSSPLSDPRYSVIDSLENQLASSSAFLLPSSAGCSLYSEHIAWRYVAVIFKMLLRVQCAARATIRFRRLTLHACRLLSRSKPSLPKLGPQKVIRIKLRTCLHESGRSNYPADFGHLRMVFILYRSDCHLQRCGQTGEDGLPPLGIFNCHPSSLFFHWSEFDQPLKCTASRLIRLLFHSRLDHP